MYQKLPEEVPYNYGQQQCMPTHLSVSQAQLMSTKEIFVKQDFDLFEAISGCEKQNIYKIFTGNIDGQNVENQKVLFRCKEKSGWCARQCCPGRGRPFTAQVFNMDQQTNKEGLPSFEFVRECTCGCPCTTRPKMKVNYTEGQSSEYIGQIVLPCTCGCNPKLEIQDKKDQLMYIIEANCCQCGLCCPCPCQSCQTVQFDVKDPVGNVITQLTKKSAGCMKSIMSDSDNFALVFPQDAGPMQRALLMSSVIFLDFMYFEKKK